MKIKKVNRDDHSSIMAKITKMHKVLSYINDPYLFENNGVQYVLGNNNGTYGIVKEEDGNLNAYSLRFPENDRDVETIFDNGKYVYYLLLNSVKKTNKKNGDNYLLSIQYDSDRSPWEYTMFFDQHIDSVCSEFSYNVSRYEDLEKQIDHCLIFNPNLVELYEKRKSLLRHEYHKYISYILGIDGASFHKRFSLGNKVLGVLQETYSTWDMIEILSEYGLLTRIPDDLTTMLMRNNEQFNEFKTVTDAYRRELGRK
ncbi:MAG: hypothetical protein J1F35_02380 [Erysipelotrichales bacterium]|nr:hypothetical protein [Erysipelotrichales bacterium]